MPLIVGLALAFGVGIFATVSGFDRDRAFYPTVLIVIASYYCLFAIIGEGSPTLLGYEIVLFALFAGLAVIGFRTSLWFVAVGLLAHGLSDFVRGDLISNRGVPIWWPIFCGAFDVAAAAYLAWRLATQRRL